MIIAADPHAHAARPWRIRTLAPDFELLDVWALPITADPAHGDTFARFLEVFVDSGMTSHWPTYPLRPTSPRDVVHGALLIGAVGLFAFRRFLGRVLALDSDRERLPIPGRAEHRVRQRLEPADRVRDTGALPPRVGSFETVYAFADEALLEIANRTIHGLLHLSWIETGDGRYRAELAVYVKSRGLGSRFYLALIGPFRHWIVYPAWLGHVARSWDARRTAGAAA
jgi:hypothetical protein